MGIENIKKSILLMSREEKDGLIGYIQGTMTPENLSGYDRYIYLVTIAEAVLGYNLTPERTSRNTLLREFVAHRLSKEGYGRVRIGELMGRDHSSITHLIRRLDDMLSLPHIYQEEVAKYGEFERLL